MSRYGLVELKEGPGGTLIPRARYDRVSLDVSFTAPSAMTGQMTAATTDEKEEVVCS